MIASYNQADTSIDDIAMEVAKVGLDCSFLVPTANGLRKSILDAVAPVRSHLKRTGYHDYGDQEQGEEHKKLSRCFLVSGKERETKKVSLYRPCTKDGDPRIWPYGQGKFCEAGNVLLLIVDDGDLYIWNASKEDIGTSLKDPSTILGSLVARSEGAITPTSELLDKLRQVAMRGPVASMRKGATGVGFTLESLLGIAANSSRKPDYKGIELKSERIKNKRRNTATSARITLFSRKPTGGRAPIKVLRKYGYRNEEKNRIQLYCSVDGKDWNSLRFKLNHDPHQDSILMVNDKFEKHAEEVFRWEMDELRGALTKKHRETFWVGARCTESDGGEFFHYVEVRHTQKPSIFLFEMMLAQGGVCIDLTMSEKPSGAAVRDHGYLFRIYQDYFDELFPPLGIYDLTAAM